MPFAELQHPACASCCSARYRRLLPLQYQSLLLPTACCNHHHPQQPHPKMLSICCVILSSAPVFSLPPLSCKISLPPLYCTQGGIASPAAGVHNVARSACTHCIGKFRLGLPTCKLTACKPGGSVPEAEICRPTPRQPLQPALCSCRCNRSELHMKCCSGSGAGMPRHTSRSRSSPARCLGACLSLRRRHHACMRGSHHLRLAAATPHSTSSGTPTRSRSITAGRRCEGEGCQSSGHAGVKDLACSCGTLCVTSAPQCGQAPPRGPTRVEHHHLPRLHQQLPPAFVVHAGVPQEGAGVHLGGMGGGQL